MSGHVPVTLDCYSTVARPHERPQPIDIKFIAVFALTRRVIGANGLGITRQSAFSFVIHRIER